MTYICSSIYYQDHDPDPRYRPATVAFEWRQFNPPLFINGKKHWRYTLPIITEYVDMTTGEILTAKDIRNQPEAWPEVRLSENTLRRQAVLNSLRKESRSLALFILAFRNNRRGITPGVDKLVEWYARLHGQRPSNVRRSIRSLEEAGILAGASLLCPLFQFSGKRMRSIEHLGEDSLASIKYLLKCQERRSPM